MFGFEIALFTILILAGKSICHPQCLDSKPPFRPVGRFQMCQEYAKFGCCGLEKESEIVEKFNSLAATMTHDELSMCGETLTNLLCQVCSPYAAHIYDTEGRPGVKSFPGLCPNYCQNMMKNCSFIVKLVTKHTRLLRLSQAEKSDGFCAAVKSNDADYCYPFLKTNRRLSNNIGTIKFYQQKEWGTNTGKSCLPLCVQEMASGLHNPVSAKHAGDQTHRLFVVEQRGVIWIYLPDFSHLSPPFLDIRNEVLANDMWYDERGLLDMTFHPKFKDNGLFYLYYSVLHRGSHHVRLSEMKVKKYDMNLADIKTERTLLNIPQPAFNHNGGQLIFLDDGYLYITTGDGGNGGDPWGQYGNGQNTKTFLGKVLRIDVDNATNGRPYGIPPDNPFVKNRNYLPEIYALGVRNMWRCSADRGSKLGKGRGRIICGDVGQGKYEEVDVIEKGANYGWRAYEGDQCYDQNMCRRGFVKNHAPPVFAYDHSVGKSITGGYVYRGCENPNLYGNYIFGDYTFGKLFLLRPRAKGKWKMSDVCMGSDAVCKSEGLRNEYAKYILSFAEDESGELYMLSTTFPVPGSNKGSIYKLVDPSRRSDPKLCQRNVTTTTISKRTTIIG